MPTPRQIRGVKDVRFDINEKKYVDFALRLEYDNLKRTEFFDTLIDFYLIRDKDFMICLEKIKILKLKGKGRFTKKLKHSYLKKEQEEKEINEKFSLDFKEISKLYDIIEEDFDKR